MQRLYGALDVTSLKLRHNLAQDDLALDVVDRVEEGFFQGRRQLVDELTKLLGKVGHYSASEPLPAFFGA